MIHANIGHGFTVTHHPETGTVWLSWTSIEHLGDDEFESIEREVEIPTEIIPALIEQLIPAHARRYPKRLDEMHYSLLGALAYATYHPRQGSLRLCFDYPTGEENRS